MTVSMPSTLKWEAQKKRGESNKAFEEIRSGGNVSWARKQKRPKKIACSIDSKRRVTMQSKKLSEKAFHEASVWNEALEERRPLSWPTIWREKASEASMQYSSSVNLKASEENVSKSVINISQYMTDAWAEIWLGSHVPLCEIQRSYLIFGCSYKSPCNQWEKCHSLQKCILCLFFWLLPVSAFISRISIEAVQRERNQRNENLWEMKAHRGSEEKRNEAERNQRRKRKIQAVWHHEEGRREETWREEEYEAIEAEESEEREERKERREKCEEAGSVHRRREKWRNSMKRNVCEGEAMSWNDSVNVEETIDEENIMKIWRRPNQWNCRWRCWKLTHGWAEIWKYVNEMWHLCWKALLNVSEAKCSLGYLRKEAYLCEEKHLSECENIVWLIILCLWSWLMCLYFPQAQLKNKKIYEGEEKESNINVCAWKQCFEGEGAGKKMKAEEEEGKHGCANTQSEEKKYLGEMSVSSRLSEKYWRLSFISREASSWRNVTAVYFCLASEKWNSLSPHISLSMQCQASSGWRGSPGLSVGPISEQKSSVREKSEEGSSDREAINLREAFSLWLLLYHHLWLY